MLTNSDLKQILDALARYGKKDSQLDAVPIDLEHPEGTFTTNDYLSIVQDGKNKTIKIKNLEKVFLLTFLTDEDFREALKGRIPGEMLENASVTTEKLADGSITTIKLGDSSVTNAKLSDNAVTSSKLADNSVTTSKIVDESVTTSKLNTNAVTTDKLANGSVTTDKIANGAVTSSKIADNSLSGANFGNNTIEGTKIKDNSIPGSKLADGAIESIDIKDGTLSGSKLADNSVTGAKLQDSVITGMKIADNSIPGSKIADSTIQNLNIANNSISGSKLVDNAITTDKIANGAINSAKLANDAITENKIADDSVTTNKIADRAVTNNKLANNSVTSDKIADNSVTSSMITDYAVTENKLDSGSVTASKIAPNAVTTTKLGDNAITSDKIVDGSITEQKLADNSVTTDKIDTDAVTNVKIADNAVTESKIATNAVTTTKIVDGNVTTLKIADNTVTTIKLADGTVTEDKLADGAVTTAKLANGLISEIQNITDATPTEGSVKPIQSGGVQVALMNRAIVGDIVGDPAQAWEPGTAEAYIDQKIAEQNAVLNAKMSRQDAVIHALNGQDIVLVSALPQTGEANKIYRLTGTDSYTDYMWDASLATPAFTAIVTYSFPGIDDEPTAGSDNLVKSRGVYKKTFLADVNIIAQDNYTGCFFRVLNNITSSYIKRYHAYTSRLNHNLNATTAERKYYPRECKSDVINIEGIVEIKFKPNASGVYSRIGFTTQSVTFPNSYNDITDVLAGGIYNGVFIIDEEKSIVVPDGAKYLVVETKYAATNTADVIDVTPEITGYKYKDVPNEIEALQNDVYEIRDEIREDLPSIHNDIDSIQDGIEPMTEHYVGMSPTVKSKKVISTYDNLWYIKTAATYYLYPVTPGDRLRIRANAINNTLYAFLVDDVNGEPVVKTDTTLYKINYASQDGEAISLNAGESVDIVVPENTNYLYVYTGNTPNFLNAPDFVGIKRNVIDCFKQGVGTGILDLNTQKDIEYHLLYQLFKGKTSDGVKNFGCINFAHITDCHGRDTVLTSKTTWERFIAFCNYYKQLNPRYILDIVDTGDVVADSAAVADVEVTGNWRVNAEDVLTVIGNHDVANKVTSSSGLSYTRTGLPAYNQFLKDNIANWGVVQPEGAAENGYCYYYKDYEIGGGETGETDPIPYGLRAIFVDCMDWVQHGDGMEYHQAQFVKDALDGALAGNKHVIVFTHAWPGTILMFDTTWNTNPYATSTIDIESDTKYQYLSALIHNFQEQGGHFVAYVCGHYHQGHIGRKTGTLTYTENNEQVIIDFDTSKPQLVICGMSANVGLGLSQASSITWVKSKTLNQDCFRFISIDTTYRYIKLLQIGRTENYQLKRKESICISYDEYPQFDPAVNYTANTIVAKEGLLWRLIKPVIVNGVTDWDSTVKVLFNRVINKN